MNPNLEKVLKLPGYQRLLILLAGVLLVAGGFAYFVFMPSYEEYQGLIAQNETLQVKLQEDRRIADNLPKFQAEYEKMQGRLKEALTQLPNAKEIPSLLAQLSSLAKESGLEVIRFQPGKETPKGFYAELPIQLKVTGAYHEIAKFFFAVGDMPRIVNVGNISLGSAKQTDGRLVLSVDCLATTYMFVDEASKSAKGGGKK